MAIERGAAVEVAVTDDADALRVWVLADGAVAVTALVQRGSQLVVQGPGVVAASPTSPMARRCSRWA